MSTFTRFWDEKDEPLFSNISNERDLEKSSLQQKNLLKTTKKSNYGSLKTEKPSMIVNYKHKLQQGETLQGISLKYGVPIEYIKRANRMWNNDLAFVKDYLIIPINKENLASLNLRIEDCDSSSHTASSLSSNKKTNEETNIENSPLKIEDYLNKYDEVINQSKLKLKSIESNGDLAHLAYNNNQTNKHLRKSPTFSNESFNSSSSMLPEYVIKSPDKMMSYYNNTSGSSSSNGIPSNFSNRAKMAHENLQRLEKEKDDLYEL